MPQDEGARVDLTQGQHGGEGLCKGWYQVHISMLHHHGKVGVRRYCGAEELEMEILHKKTRK